MRDYDSIITDKVDKDFFHSKKLLHSYVCQ